MSEETPVTPPPRQIPLAALAVEAPPVARSEAPTAPQRSPGFMPSGSFDGPQPPVRGREVLAVALLAALCDVTIFRGQGFAGYAALFAAAPALLLWGSPRRHFGLGVWVAGLMLALLAAKLAWCGSWLLVAAGAALLAAFAMSVAGLPPYVLEAGVFASQTILAGYKGLIRHWQFVSRASPTINQAAWLRVALPAVTLTVFGVIFILANPDLLTSFGEGLERLLNSLREWMMHYAPTPLEVLFWAAVVWIGIGLMRPVMDRAVWAESSNGAARQASEPQKPAPAPLFEAFRNTLAMVIVLFAVYLVFEFATLWFREFPEGFYYSGYAHQGAAWLTVALALATAVLSVVFKGRVLNDPRLPFLRKLAWLWSLENMLLALAVYNRLFIYIGFNGMTRMRIVGLFGISVVVVGFILVLWKIAFGKGFLWLMRRQMWALALTIYLFALTPVDTIVVRYNVERILAGDPAPCVQISVHPINSEGVSLLTPLIDCEDPEIREGVRALLAQRRQQAEELALSRESKGWTVVQFSDRWSRENLNAASEAWGEYSDTGERDRVLERFHEYAYQWY